MNILLNKLYLKTIDKMLRLKFVMDIYGYIHDKTNDNYRELESSIEADKYPVKAPAMISSIELLEDWSNTQENKIFFSQGRIISSWDTSNEIIDAIHYEKMFFLQFFILLEGYGDEIVEIVNKSYHNKMNKHGKSWHSSINSYNEKTLEKNVDSLAKVLNTDSLLFPDKYVSMLLELKKKRNLIAHKDEYDKGYFDSDIDSILILVSYLYYTISKDNRQIEIFPWEDTAEWFVCG